MDSLFFIASKLVWGLIQPGAWLVGASALALLGLILNRRRLALIAGSLGLALTLGFAALPVGDRLIHSLESRWPLPVEPAGVTGIIVLGGAEETVFVPPGAQIRLNEGAERFTEGLRLAQRYPGAKLVFTGGYASLTSRHGNRGEPVALRFYRDLGIDPARLVLETASRNTAENARLTLELVQPAPGETWLLVTSAFHMRRAMLSFESAGWTGLTPWPVDYRADLSRLVIWDFPRNLRLTSVALREYIGLIAYSAFAP